MPWCIVQCNIWEHVIVFKQIRNKIYVACNMNITLIIPWIQNDTTKSRVMITVDFLLNAVYPLLKQDSLCTVFSSTYKMACRYLNHLNLHLYSNLRSFSTLRWNSELYCNRNKFLTTFLIVEVFLICWPS